VITHVQPPSGMTQQIKEARQPRTHQHLRPILIELFQKTPANTEANQILMSAGNTQYSAVLRTTEEAYINRT
jgi:hypothetical protein